MTAHTKTADCSAPNTPGTVTVPTNPAWVRGPALVEGLPEGYHDALNGGPIPIAQIHPSPTNPRTVFDQGGIDELAASIKQHGLLQPLTVRREAQDSYTIIAGERRYRACKAAGMSHVPCVVRECTEEQARELALVENLQRRDLNPMEEARGYQALRDLGLTQEQIAERVNRSRPAVANAMRLLGLPEDVHPLFDRLTTSHGMELLRHPRETEVDLSCLYDLALLAAEEGISVTELREHVDDAIGDSAKAKAAERKLAERKTGDPGLSTSDNPITAPAQTGPTTAQNRPPIEQKPPAVEQEAPVAAQAEGEEDDEDSAYPPDSTPEKRSAEVKEIAAHLFVLPWYEGEKAVGMRVREIRDVAEGEPGSAGQLFLSMADGERIGEVPASAKAPCLPRDDDQAKQAVAIALWCQRNARPAHERSDPGAWDAALRSALESEKCPTPSEHTPAGWASAVLSLLHAAKKHAAGEQQQRGRADQLLRDAEEADRRIGTLARKEGELQATVKALRHENGELAQKLGEAKRQMRDANDRTTTHAVTEPFPAGDGPDPADYELTDRMCLRHRGTGAAMTLRFSYTTDEGRLYDLWDDHGLAVEGQTADDVRELYAPAEGEAVHA